MKKTALFLLSPMLVLTLAACGNKKTTVGGDDKGEQAPPSQPQGQGQLPRPQPESDQQPPQQPMPQPGNLPGHPGEPGRPSPPQPTPDGGFFPPTVEPSNQGMPRPGSEWRPPSVKGSPSESWLLNEIDPLMRMMSSSEPSVSQGLARSTRLTLALGYFEGFHKKNFVYGNVDYGRHAAVDPFLRAIADEVLTRFCVGRLQLCGFFRVRSTGVETIYERFGYDGQTQQIRVISGAVDVRHELNTGAYADEQRSRTQRAEAGFLRSFVDSDLVVYVGHSREGGGPDFAPPRLKNEAVDYPSYQQTRTSARKLVGAVAARDRKARAFAMLSCDTSAHFLREVQGAGAGLELVTTKGLIRSEDQLAGSLATMELFLRQGHLGGLKQFVAGRAVLAKSLEPQAASPIAQR